MTATHPADVLTNQPPILTRPAGRLTKFINHLQPSPEAVVLILAIPIGIVTGLGVIAFHYLISWIHTLLLEDFMGLVFGWGSWTLACVPTLGGILVGLMRWRWTDLGPSMSSLIAATREAKKSLPLRPIAKMVAAAISLGSGASLGPEGPSVELGGNFGILLSRILQVSQERQQLLLGAGAAAGLAAGFNAPIAGVFFALEIVLGTTFATSAVSVVVLAAVVSSLVAQFGLGSQPAFALPAYEVRSPLELPLYMGLGFLASLVSWAYLQSIQWARRCFRGEVTGLTWLGRVPKPVAPAIGGLFVGIAALQWPQMLGVGYETIEAMLQDVKFSLTLLLVLLVVKLVMTSISLGSGFVGGIFAPAMFLGASLGSAYGKILALILPASMFNIAAPPAYAMVGMAAVLAGSAKSPLTAILLLFELTRDYRIVLPLMAAVGISVWLVERFNSLPETKDSWQPLGLNLQKDPNLEILTEIPVSEAMHVPNLNLKATMPLLDAGLALTAHRCRSALVLDESGGLVGIVTLQDIYRSIARCQGRSTPEEVQNLTLQTACTTNLVYAYPHESLAQATEHMAARGLHQLPVVDPTNPNLVLGILEQEGINLACSVAHTRKALSPYQK
ncbi:chloride channel protein [Merismopedia glauca]|uniref:Chloride channel protein n=1 Tax=Merismopedia glauca CCAP 1448/3 TaxID=1296344 RepID=A0A2T1C6Z6_9CYAN|nr:chloride channel protein [Merismopedia glauca]PSB03938.1 chloride channel protein [Merismopedia glauca CCAP 1448/3]